MDRTEHNPLGLEHDGEAVTEIGITIPNAGGGLREPLSVDMTLIDQFKDKKRGDTAFLVLQVAKVGETFDAAKDHDGWRRTDKYKVEAAAVIDADLALAAIEEERERTVLAIEAAQGIQRLSVVDDDEDGEGAGESVSTFVPTPHLTPGEGVLEALRENRREREVHYEALEALDDAMMAGWHQADDLRVPRTRIADASGYSHERVRQLLPPKRKKGRSA